MASCAGGLPDTLHHPLPDTASGQARRAGTPSFTRKSAPVTPGEASKPLLRPREALRRKAEPTLGQKPVTKEGTLPDGSHDALLGVDLEAEPAFEEGHNGGHDPLSHRLRPHVDVAVPDQVRD